MSGSKRCLGAVAAVLLLLNCGGRFTDDEAPSPTSATNGGAASMNPPCVVSGAPADSCGGASGDDGEIERCARLRTACDLSVKVNRGGAPVSIDPCLR
jgi:hypothetical protein